MTGFDELVERTRRELGDVEGRADAGGELDLDAWRESLQARSEGFEAELGRHLNLLERSSQPFDLSPEGATTPARRLLGGALRGLLRLGGLGKFLGSTQWQANQATLRSLRLLQARSREQDRALAELGDALRTRRDEQRSEDPAR